MRAHRSYAAGKKRRQVYMKKLAVVVSALVLVLCMSILLGCNFADAHGSTDEAPVEHRYYKSIEIQSGDTLWGIAEEYMNEKDGSIIEYIDEVKEINGLKSDDIQDSQYLTIAYYDTAFR